MIAACSGDSTALIGEYCGIHIPTTITSSGPCITFYFISDAKAEYRGIELQYYSVDACKFKDHNLICPFAVTCNLKNKPNIYSL